MLAEMTRLFTPEQTLIFLTLANLLYVVCYGVRDVLWLRIFGVTAMVTIMPYYIWGTEQAQINCICWNVLFLAINLFWIVVIVRERRPPNMTDQEKKLYKQVFQRSCTEQQMLKLLSAANQQTCRRGDELIEKGSHARNLILIEEGYAEVITGGKEIIRLGNGDFVGEMSFLTGLPAVTSVVADSEMKLYRWTKESLDELFESRVELKAAMNEVLARDLTRKLTAEHIAVPELSVTMMVKDM